MNVIVSLFWVMMMVAGTRMVMAMVMSAATFVVLVVVMTAAAFVVMVMVMAAGARVVMRMAVIGRGRVFPGRDGHFGLHGAGKGGQFRDQGIGILRGQSQLTGGEGNDRFLHTGVGIEFFLHPGGTARSAKMLHNIYFLFHEDPSRLF